MRIFLVSAAALFVVFGAYTPASAAAAPALAKNPVYSQAQALVEKAGWRRRRWRRGWYGPRVYGYRYRRRRLRRGWYGPRVYGYYNRPYRYRRWRYRRRRWW